MNKNIVGQSKGNIFLMVMRCVHNRVMAVSVSRGIVQVKKIKLLGKCASKRAVQVRKCVCASKGISQ